LEDLFEILLQEDALNYVISGCVSPKKKSMQTKLDFSYTSAKYARPQSIFVYFRHDKTLVKFNLLPLLSFSISLHYFCEAPSL
jgi:hypothetical protein